MYQLEVGKSGTPHYQGYIRWKNDKTGRIVRKLCPHVGKWDIRKGSHEQARHYCMKPVTGCACEHCCSDPPPERLEGPWEVGTPPTPGVNPRLTGFHQACKAGASVHYLYEEYPDMMLKFPSSGDRMRNHYAKKRTWLTELVVVWGGQGTGKSTYVRTRWPDAYWGILFKSKESPWFQGYEGQDVVVVDEFRGQFSQTDFKQYIDHTDVTVNIKNSSGPFLAKILVIISNHNPETDWWISDRDSPNPISLPLIEGVGRRFLRCRNRGEWHHMTKVVDPDMLAQQEKEIHPSFTRVDGIGSRDIHPDPLPGFLDPDAGVGMPLVRTGRGSYKELLVPDPGVLWINSIDRRLHGPMPPSRLLCCKLGCGVMVPVSGMFCVDHTRDRSRSRSPLANGQDRSTYYCCKAERCMQSVLGGGFCELHR